MDLSDAEFYQANLDNFNFSGCQISGTNFDQVSLVNADFSGIGSFEGSYWYKTQWWMAKKIDKKLLIYLINKHPFNSKIEYSKISGQKYDLKKYSYWLKKSTEKD